MAGHGCGSGGEFWDERDKSGIVKRYGVEVSRYCKIREYLNYYFDINSC